MGVGAERNRPCPCGSRRKFKRCCLYRSHKRADQGKRDCSICGGRCLLLDRRRRWFPVEMLEAHGYREGNTVLSSFVVRTACREGSGMGKKDASLS
jgi:hypothetical protein